MELWQLLPIISLSIALIIKILILVCFLYQCSDYKQLNYDLTKTYSTLTSVALMRLTITMIFVGVYLTYYVTLNESYNTIALFVSVSAPTLHAIFFVLRLHMTFLNSTYQVSKCLLIFYSMLCSMVFLPYIFYLMVLYDIIDISSNSESKDTILLSLFVATEVFRLLVLFLVSFQFVQKLILLGVGHYSPSNHELHSVNLLPKKDNIKIKINARGKTPQLEAQSINSFFSSNSSITNSMNNSIRYSTTSSNYGIVGHGNHGMVNIGGTGVIRVQKAPQNERNINKSPFSVIQMDLIKVVSKQTFLAILDFIVIVIYTISAAMNRNDVVVAVLYDILVALQYTITSMAIWLSFEFANKQYRCIFGKCDSCCLKCATCAIEKVEENQRHNKITVGRFNI